jgi:hypothetical protein
VPSELAEDRELRTKGKAKAKAKGKAKGKGQGQGQQGLSCSFWRHSLNVVVFFVLRMIKDEFWAQRIVCTSTRRSCHRTAMKTDPKVIVNHFR